MANDVLKKQAVYKQSIEPLLERAIKLAELWHIPLLTVAEVEGWLRIQKHAIEDCSELACAYREVTGRWEGDEL